MRIIMVTTCKEWPFYEYNDGRGHRDPFESCKKYKILLYDWRGLEKFDVRSGIHPRCRLQKVE